jgi:hypothetical protein
MDRLCTGITLEGKAVMRMRISFVIRMDNAALIKGWGADQVVEHRKRRGLRCSDMIEQ